MHLRHVKYQPHGGPDGGDGGHGGNIILRGNHNFWTLLHLKYQRHVFAEHGGNGGRDKCHGTDGKNQYIDVPCGTVVYDAETGKFHQSSPTLCAARRADAGDDRHHGIEAAGRRRTGRFPQCGQVDAAVRALKRTAPHRQLSVYDAGTVARHRGLSRPAEFRDGRHSGHYRRGQRRKRARTAVSAAHRAQLPLTVHGAGGHGRHQERI